METFKIIRRVYLPLIGLRKSHDINHREMRGVASFMEVPVSPWGKRHTHCLFVGLSTWYLVSWDVLFKIKSHGQSKTLCPPLLSPSPALLCQEEKLAHQAESDVILQLLPDSPTQTRGKSCGSTGSE